MSQCLSASKLVDYINQIRKDPKFIIPHIQNILHKFVDEKNYQLTSGISIQTVEGKSAWKDAIRYLNIKQPLDPLSLNQQLIKAAYDIAIDLGENNILKGTQQNYKWIHQNMTKYCLNSEDDTIKYSIAIELKSQKKNHELQALISLIINDGIIDRKHRQNIFNQSYRYLGIGFSSTKTHHLIVITYSSQNLKKIYFTKNQKIVDDKFNQFQKQKPLIKNQKEEEISKIFQKEIVQNIQNSMAFQQKRIVDHSQIRKQSTVDGKKTILMTIVTSFSDGSVETTIQESYVQSLKSSS